MAVGRPRRAAPAKLATRCARPATLPFARAQKPKLGAPCSQVKYYAFIEICLWLPTTWIICNRFQPAIRFYSNETGREIVHRGAAVLERWAPSTHTKLSGLAQRVYGSPNGRTTAEWLLINKVVSPVAFPIKMGLGHLWAERSKVAAAAAAKPVTKPEEAR